jgi:hypothetical protein
VRGEQDLDGLGWSHTLAPPQWLVGYSLGVTSVSEEFRTKTFFQRVTATVRFTAQPAIRVKAQYNFIRGINRKTSAPNLPNG